MIKTRPFTKRANVKKLAELYNTGTYNQTELGEIFSVTPKNICTQLQKLRLAGKVA